MLGRRPPNRLVIARMLNNLRAACQRDGDLVRLAIVMQLRQQLPEFAAEAAAAEQACAILNWRSSTERGPVETVGRCQGAMVWPGWVAAGPGLLITSRQANWTYSFTRRAGSS